ncbi:MAG: sugar phosphate isomerase/epimerase [Elusimicrobia bacterium]|nr:sugar phosphate isomerase/epimerase [Elusimicrobiota bacterium]
MKFGMYSFFGYVLPLEERLRLIREAGFDFTALWWGEEEPDIRAGRKHELPRLARDLGLAVDNIHVPFETCNRLWSPDKAEREAWVNDNLGWVEDCARAEVEILVMHPTHGKDFLPPGEDGLEAFARVLAAAERSKVRLAVENTRGELHLDKLLERFSSPFLGLCYDSSHARIVSPAPLALLERHGGRLLTTHLSDNDGEADRHWPPGEGVVDWRGLAAEPAFRRLGAVMLEVLGPRNEPWPAPETFLRDMRRRLQGLWGI